MGLGSRSEHARGRGGGVRVAYTGGDRRVQGRCEGGKSPSKGTAAVVIGPWWEPAQNGSGVG